MENIWDKFAREDPQFYILTEETDYSTEEGKEYFFETGEKFTQETLNNVSNLLPGKERALEIGCGIGRLTLPHSKIFDEIIAVDISNIMLENLRENAIEFDKKNIKTALPQQKWDDYIYDYAYSFIVFQHIESLQIIEDYITRISNSLRIGGIIQIQFDTRNANILYRLRNTLPDMLLPKTQKRGIRRVRRNEEDLSELFRQNELEIVEELFPVSEKHTFILRKQ